MPDDTVSLADLSSGLAATTAPSFIQTNLISDGSIPAATTDPNLINPWGVALSPTSPFWISENGTGLSSIDSISGSTITLNVIPAVTIPAPAGTTTAPAAGDTSTPTGQVFNSFPGAFVLSNGTAATFLFATEDGTVAGWNQAAGATALLPIDNSATGAVYKGLAIGMSASGPTLYAANFNSGTVDMFDSTFKPLKSFSDPTVPAGYAPFNVQVLNNELHVTYALQDAAKHDDVAGLGNGFVDAFDLDGNVLGRVGSNGMLDSPWGLAIAPATFGSYAGALLVGNFGDGAINVFDQKSNTFVAQLTGPDGNPITIDGLWALTPGNGGSGGDPNTIYFSAGPSGEIHGLFGSLIAAPSTTPGM